MNRDRTPVRFAAAAAVAAVFLLVVARPVRSAEAGGTSVTVAALDSAAPPAFIEHTAALPQPGASEPAVDSAAAPAQAKASGPDAEAAPAPDSASPAAPPLSRPAPEAAVRGAEPLPEEAEKAPELVGPDDDRLLQEVERRVSIAPPGPAIEVGEPSYDIPLELNAKVLDYVEIFQTTRRRNFEQGLFRSRRYEAGMKAVFREYGLPTDLFYLALIESGYNPRAYSYARAMGIWQFISSTGRLYGLRRTEWVDERCDPEKSTRAAARHLRDLHDEFGSWPLVLAAYNAGKGRVRRAIEKAGTSDFWALDLPAQTRNYVPAFFAALVVAKAPERYGFEAEFEGPVPTEVAVVAGGTRLSLVAALCGTSVDAIRELNPELRRNVVPPGGTYTLRIPEGRGAAFAAGLAKVPPGKTTEASWSEYRVVAGDTLFGIAQRFGTTAEAIQEANRLADSRIRPGDRLTIPGERSAAAIPRAPARVAGVSAATPATHQVQSGDNPWAISRRFNLPLESLLEWNDLEPGEVLRVGRTLRLRPPAEEGGGVAAADQAPATAYYEVRRGDTLWEIARRNSVSVEEILRLNGFAPEHRLRTGDRVLVPASL